MSMTVRAGSATLTLVLPRQTLRMPKCLVASKAWTRKVVPCMMTVRWRTVAPRGNNYVAKYLFRSRQCSSGTPTRDKASRRAGGGNDPKGLPATVKKGPSAPSGTAVEPPRRTRPSQPREAK